MNARDQRGLARRPVRRLVRRSPALRDEGGPAAPKRSEGGFMLLEVILAVAIMAISLFALINSLGRCVAAARAVQSYSISEILLANKSFEFRAERAADILDQEGSFSDYPGYSWSRRLELTDTEGLWKQTITVYWYERGKLASDSVAEYKYLPEKQR
jgi:general secretion pathway protein I